MPITIPPFAAYQAPLFPLPSRWRQLPPEGDRVIACEIDWGITVAAGLAVQLSLQSGVLEFSQICALSVDNGRNGADVDFIFPDTGKQLTVPAYSQGTYPVFTNAQTFYVYSQGAVTGDVTNFEILNSVPPPVSVLPSQEQSHAGQVSVDMGVNATTQLVPASITGTLQAMAITINESNATASAQSATLNVIDGTGTVLYGTVINIPPNTAQTVPLNVSGLRVRFINGIRAVVSGSSVTPGVTGAQFNLYYSVP